jgi:hypothetical protein
MAAQLHIQGVSIVLRGDFSPAIFHPAWFAANGLIRDQEADAAQVELIHSKVAAFTVEWLQLMVTEDRLQASTTQQSYDDPLRDLVLGVLSLLPSTPLRQVGINCDFDFELATAEAWHTVGHRLAPKQVWSAVLKEPGMRSLTMEGQRADGRRGYVQVRVEPSSAFVRGIHVHVNDHYELEPETRGVYGTSHATQILTEQWRESLTRSQAIALEVVAE